MTLPLDIVDSYEVSFVSSLLVYRGEKSEIYSLTDHSGKNYFLKVYPSGRKEKKELSVVLTGISGILGENSFVNLPQIVPLKNKEFIGDFHDSTFLLYCSVDGKNLSQIPLKNDQYSSLSHMLLKLHSHDKNDIFPTYPLDFYLRDIQSLLANTPLPKNNQSVSAAVIQLKKLSSDIIKTKKLVLCHTDFTPNNILIGSDSSLTVINWEDSGFSYKEIDFIHLAGLGTTSVFEEKYLSRDNFTFLLDEYYRLGGQKLNRTIFEFFLVYFRLRNKLKNPSMSDFYFNFEPDLAQLEYIL